MREKWTSIKGYERLYEVSSRGRIRRIAGTYGCKNGRVLRLNQCRGYKTIGLCKNNKVRHFRVNRLVAIHFIPNPKNLPITNHINGIIDDNRVENLEWCTQQENITHMHEVTKKAAKPKVRIRCIETGIVYDSMRAAAIHMNISGPAIVRCIYGEYKQTNGYTFERA